MKKFKRLFAALVAAAMMMALCCVSAFAEDKTTTDKINITKTVEAAADNADGTFTFKVTKDSSNKYTSAWDDKTVTISTSNKTGSTYLDLSDFSSAELGVYNFTLTEENPAAGYSKKTPTNNYTLTVNKYKDTDGTVKIEAAVKENGTGDKKDAADFVNTYLRNQNLTVTKTVENTAYEKVNAEYPITVTLTKADDDSVNILPTEITATKGSDTVTVNRNAASNDKSATYTFNLKAGETIVLTNLPAGVTYTVEEDTTGINNAYFVQADISNKTGKLNSDITATVTNKYTDKAATGVLTRIMPFVAMIVAAGAAAAAYFVIARKRRAED